MSLEERIGEKKNKPPPSFSPRRILGIFKVVFKCCMEYIKDNIN